MERMCLLIKFDYMSKEAYGSLRAAERGFPVNWAGYLYEKLMADIELKDKRKSANRCRIGPYLQALFSPSGEQESGLGAD